MTRCVANSFPALACTIATASHTWSLDTDIPRRHASSKGETGPLAESKALEVGSTDGGISGDASAVSATGARTRTGDRDRAAETLGGGDDEAPPSALRTGLRPPPSRPAPPYSGPAPDVSPGASSESSASSNTAAPTKASASPSRARNAAGSGRSAGHEASLHRPAKPESASRANHAEIGR